MRQNQEEEGRSREKTRRFMVMEVKLMMIGNDERGEEPTRRAQSGKKAKITGQGQGKVRGHIRPGMAGQSTNRELDRGMSQVGRDKKEASCSQTVHRLSRLLTKA